MIVVVLLAIFILILLVAFGFMFLWRHRATINNISAFHCVFICFISKFWSIMGNFPFHVSLHINSSLLYFLIWVIHVISQLCIKNTYLKSNQSKTFQRFIYLIFIFTYFSSSAARFINLSTFAPGSRKTKLGHLWWLFQRSRDPIGDEFRRLRYFRENK